MARKTFSMFIALVFILSIIQSAAAETPVGSIVKPPEKQQPASLGPTVISPKSGEAVAASPGAQTTSASTFTPSTLYPHSTYKSWINRLKASNTDVTGWLKIPGTNINHRVLQTTRENGNEYYNTRDWMAVNYPVTYPNYAKTCEYLDVRVVIGDTWAASSKNTVIYGHNWTNLSSPYHIGEAYTQHVMFGQLPSYTSLEFAKANPYIYYSDDKKEGIWKVFAVGTVEETFAYNVPNPNEEAYQTILNEWKLRSVLKFDVDVQTSDRILTLSTCTREFPSLKDKQRFVVVARLLRPGESETDAVTVTANPKPKRPTTLG